MDMSKFTGFISITSLVLIIAVLLSVPFVSPVSAEVPYFPISIYPSNPVDGDVVEVSVSNYNDLAAGAVFEWYHNGTKVREIEKTFTDTLLSDSYVVQSGEWVVTVYLYDRTEPKQLINSSTISFTVQPSPSPTPTPFPTPTSTLTPTVTPTPTPESTVSPTTSGGTTGAGGAGGGGFGGFGGGGGAPVAPQPTSTATPTPTPTPAITPAITPAPSVTQEKHEKTGVQEQKPSTPVPSVKETEEERPLEKPPVNATEKSINETGETQESTPEQTFKIPLGAEVGILGLIVALVLRKRT